jgi:hypothetical protein
MNIDTENTIYLCIDTLNAEIHIFTPAKNIDAANIEELRLDDPDPYGAYKTDPAIYALLCDSEMRKDTFEL